MKQKLFRFGIPLSTSLLLLSFSAYTQLPEFEWVKQIASKKDVSGNSVAVDKEGYIYTVGEFQDTAHILIGNSINTIPSSAGRDAFLTKQDPSGNFLWIKNFGTAEASAIAVNDSGYIYITGSYSGTVNFNPGSNTDIYTATPPPKRGDGKDFYISKFNSSGDFIWVKTGGNTNDDIGKGIAFDEYSDDIYITGNFGPGDLDLNFGQGVVNLRNNGDAASFILRVKSDGSLVWAKALGDTSGSAVSAMDIAVDKKGNVLTTGSFTGTVDFDPHLSSSYTMAPLVPAATNVFVSKLDSSGNFVWAKSMGGSEQDVGLSIVTDEYNNIYLTGSFRSIANFDPNGTFFLYPFGARDVFICKLKEDGALVWAKNVGSATDDAGEGIALDKLGNVYTTGWFQSPRSEFNPGSNPEDTFNLVSYGGKDGFILKLDNDGNFVWAVNIGGSDPKDGSNAIFVENGFIYTTGIFYSTANFDPSGPNSNKLTSKGVSDAFILKLKDCLPLTGQGISVLGPDTICKGGAYAYSIHPTSGVVTYKWILPQGWEGESNNDSILVIANGGGAISTILYGLCDSVIINYDVTLGMNPVEITVKGMQLSTTNPDEQAAWQWYLEGEEINGATDSILNVEENGEYSVVVTGKNGCVDTAFYTVTNATSIRANDLNTVVKVYPNPASERVFLESPVAVSVAITGIDGRGLHNAAYDHVSKSLNVSTLNAGIYLIHIKDMSGNLIKVEKLVVAK